MTLYVDRSTCIGHIMSLISFTFDIKVKSGEKTMTQKGDKAFGTRIKELREKKKLTQERLAELIEMDSRSLSRIETGISFTTIDKLKKLAKALDVTVQDLFSVDDQQDKQKLILEMNRLLKTAEIEDVRLAYKIIFSILR